MEPPCEFELEYILGRRANDRRANVKIDYMDRIVYQASSMQVFMTEEESIEESERG